MSYVFFCFLIALSARLHLPKAQKDLPVQHLLATKPLRASIVIGSFGASKALDTTVFDLDVKRDASAPAPTYDAPIRYGKQPEINHIFREDPRSPPKIISLAFVMAVLATIPVLLVGVRSPSLSTTVDDQMLT